MSDGPHKSLPMRARWKALSRRADNQAFSAEEVAEAVAPALIADWTSEVSDALFKLVRQALASQESSLFADQVERDVEALRSRASTPMESLLIDAASDAAASGLTGEAALRAAVADTLTERGLRGIRQVEEHWLREVKDRRAANVRARLEASLAAAPIAETAANLLGGAKARDVAPVKRDDIEDGVPF